MPFWGFGVADAAKDEKFSAGCGYFRRAQNPTQTSGHDRPVNFSTYSFVVWNKKYDRQDGNPCTELHLRLRKRVAALQLSAAQPFEFDGVSTLSRQLDHRLVLNLFCSSQWPNGTTPRSVPCTQKAIKNTIVAAKTKKLKAKSNRERPLRPIAQNVVSASQERRISNIWSIFLRSPPSFEGIYYRSRNIWECSMVCFLFHIWLKATCGTTIRCQVGVGANANS